MKEMPTVEMTIIDYCLHAVTFWFVQTPCRVFLRVLDHLGSMPACLSVFMHVCLSQALLLKHDLFRPRQPQVKTPQIGRFKDSKWWGVRTTRVDQVVRAPDQCFKSCKIEQQNISVCLPTCLSVCLSAYHA